jgi:hypothetical protein
VEEGDFVIVVQAVDSSSAARLEREFRFHVKPVREKCLDLALGQNYSFPNYYTAPNLSVGALEGVLPNGMRYETGPFDTISSVSWISNGNSGRDRGLSSRGRVSHR